MEFINNKTPQVNYKAKIRVAIKNALYLKSCCELLEKFNDCGNNYDGVSIKISKRHEKIIVGYPCLDEEVTSNNHEPKCVPVRGEGKNIAEAMTNLFQKAEEALK